MMLKRAINTTWIQVLILTGLFTPQYFFIFPVLNIVLDVVKIAASVLILLLFFMNISKNIKRRFNILLIALVIELLISTLFSAYASFFACVQTVGSLFVICILFEELMINSPYNGLRCLYGYFSLITLINTISVILFPGGLYGNFIGERNYWFLGHDNSAYYFYILTSTFAMLYCGYITKRITFLALLDWVNAFVYVFHNDIATGIACQVIWLLLVAGYQFKLFRKLLKAQYALYIMLGCFVLVVLMRRLILEPVVLALGRVITLSGRTRIWDRTINLILKKPLFGYGICDGNVYASLIGFKGVTMAHDWLLNLGFAGGIVAVVIHILQVGFAVKEGRAFRDSTYYRCVVIGMIIIFLRAVTEGSNWEGYFIFPAMICYSKEFLDGINSKEGIKKRMVRFKFGEFKGRSRLI